MNNQFNKFQKIIKIIKENNLTTNIILIGSWAYYLYCNKLFSKKIDVISLRTTDIDFYIPRHEKFKKNIDLIELLKKNGYEHTRTKSGVDKFISEDFTIEFLTEEIGRGEDKAYYIKSLELHTIQIRYMNLLKKDCIFIEVDKNTKIKLPLPENYALHKLLISTLRKKELKSNKDREQGLEILNLLFQNNQFNKVKELYKTLHKKWKDKVDTSLKKSGNEYLIEKLKEKF